jgi:hypothetical protein
VPAVVSPPSELPLLLHGAEERLSSAMHRAAPFNEV